MHRGVYFFMFQKQPHSRTTPCCMPNSGTMHFDWFSRPQGCICLHIPHVNHKSVIPAGNTGYWQNRQNFDFSPKPGRQTSQALTAADDTGLHFRKCHRKCNDATHQDWLASYTKREKQYLLTCRLKWTTNKCYHSCPGTTFFTEDM